jgi:hypothetical protein
MRAAERCTGVTNAVFGAADGASVRAERAPPLMGLGSGRGRVRLRQARGGGCHIAEHKAGWCRVVMDSGYGQLCAGR